MKASKYHAGSFVHFARNHMSRSNLSCLWHARLIKAKICLRKCMFLGLFDRVYQHKKTTSLLPLFKTARHVARLLILANF
jgi:hypothetical protein